MTRRHRTLQIVLGTAAAAVTLIVRRHIRRSMGTRVPGGILVPDVALYDAVGHGFLMRPLQRRIAADVAAATSPAASVLEVGCGPGRLSIRMARIYGLDVTGLDLDPAMIDRARANAARESQHLRGRAPAFCVGDVASLPFPDGSFDLVVSTLSLHHWADPQAGLAEMARVLRLGGRALIWDFRPGRIPLHGPLPDPAEQVDGTSLRLIGSTAWTWPWRSGCSVGSSWPGRTRSLDPARRGAGEPRSDRITRIRTRRGDGARAASHPSRRRDRSVRGRGSRSRS